MRSAFGVFCASSLLVLAALPASTAARRSGLLGKPGLLVRTSHGGQLTFTRHGNTVDFTLKFSKAVTGINLGFYGSTIGEKSEPAESGGTVKVPDEDIGDFAEPTGYCVFGGGVKSNLTCQKQAAKRECEPEDHTPECTIQPIAAGSEIRGKIIFTHIQKSPAGYGDGYTPHEETIETKTVHFK